MATVADLGARVLRKLRVSLVPQANRLAVSAPSSSADVAALALRDLGIPIAEANRAAPLPPISASAVATDALNRLGYSPAYASSGLTFTRLQIAQRVLLKLAVIAAGETPASADLSDTGLVVEGVHESLAAKGWAAWTVDNVPEQVVEHYIIMAANQAGAQYEKPGTLESYQAAEQMVRQQSLSGAVGLSIATDRVGLVHEALNGLGLVSWPISAIPAAYGEPYTTMTMVLLSAYAGAPRDAQSRQVDQSDWDASVERARKLSLVAGAQARAVAQVRSIHAELSAAGIASWDVDAIPASMVDAYAGAITAQLQGEIGKPVDPAQIQGAYARIRMLAMNGPAGQALAEQKVRAVHFSLEAKGRVRWSLFDIPRYAEEPYVIMAAALLAPEVDMPPDAAGAMVAERELAKIVALPSAGGSVQAVYF